MRKRESRKAREQEWRALAKSPREWRTHQEMARRAWAPEAKTMREGVEKMKQITASFRLAS